jgi:hypothetical protein
MELCAAYGNEGVIACRIVADTRFDLLALVAVAARVIARAHYVYHEP